ncbi:hypothetical protein ABK905_13100 [Acerihabitans sp. KWT182]|uniref:Uncharacterized protein n=1 Tax=Acerihabitans sp. KWT182 TaxID=3157919 RepID=A0AAU7QF30_9GAMM
MQAFSQARSAQSLSLLHENIFSRREGFGELEWYFEDGACCIVDLFNREFSIEHIAKKFDPSVISLNVSFWPYHYKPLIKTWGTGEIYQYAEGSVTIEKATMVDFIFLERGML